MRMGFCFILVCLLVFQGCASASPEPIMLSGAITLRLDADKVFEAPLSRWARELTDLVRLDIEYLWADDAEAVALALVMGEHTAFTMEILDIDEGSYLRTSLSDAPVSFAPLPDWAFALLDGARLLESVKPGGRTLVRSGGKCAVALDRAGIALRKWNYEAREATEETDSAPGEIFDICESMALICEWFASDFDAVYDRNVLRVEIARSDLAQTSIALTPVKNASPADAAYSATLARDALLATCRAIAANAPIQDGGNQRPAASTMLYTTNAS